MKPKRGRKSDRLLHAVFKPAMGSMLLTLGEADTTKDAAVNQAKPAHLYSDAMRFLRGWSELEPLKDVVENERAGVGAGAYVSLVRDRPIHRAVGVDEKEILDIGGGV